MIYIRKHLSRGKLENFAMKKEKDQSRFQALLTPHVVYVCPLQALLGVNHLAHGSYKPCQVKITLRTELSSHKFMTRRVGIQNI